MPDITIESEYRNANDALSLLTGTLGAEGDLAAGITKEGALTPEAPAAPESVTSEMKETTQVQTPASPIAEVTPEQKAEEKPEAPKEEKPEDVPAYDPAQVVILKDGTRTTVAALEGSVMLKPKYDQRVTELQKKERELAEKSGQVEQNLEYLKAVESDPFTLVYTTAIKAGSTREAALQAAMAASGISVAPPKQDGPPKEGTEEYYLTPFEQLGIEPGTVEYDKWYSGNAEARIAKRAREEREATVSEIKKLITPAAKVESPEDATDKEVRQSFFESNRTVLNSAPSVILDLLKIDVSALSPEEKDAVAKALEASAVLPRKGLPNGYMVNDRDWMETNALSEADMENIVLRADIKGALAKKPASPQPQLLKPPIEQSVKTIAALPTNDGQVPESLTYAGDSARQNVEDALNMLHG
ncbi:hypothetical protein KGP36_01655 [Patescibacteria group bacterium]|nr:hypothetical protein [Patescibacteria group bacterium]